MKHKVGAVTLTKADANAKTAYVHRLSHDKKTGKTTLRSELIKIDEKLAFEPTTQAVVDKWNNIAVETFKKSGFEGERHLRCLLSET